MDDTTMAPVDDLEALFEDENELLLAAGSQRTDSIRSDEVELIPEPP